MLMAEPKLQLLQIILVVFVIFYGSHKDSSCYCSGSRIKLDCWDIKLVVEITSSLDFPSRTLHDTANKSQHGLAEGK